MQTYINKNEYFGKIEMLRKAVNNYYEKNNENYFNNYIFIHNLFNLIFIHGKAILLFSLTPIKNYEYLIISEDFNDDVVELFFSVLQGENNLI